MTPRATASARTPPASSAPQLDHVGRLLVETGAISEDQAQVALTEQRSSGAPFTDILAKLGFVTEAIVRDAVSGAFGVESVDLDRAVAEPDAMAAIPESVARRFLAVGLTLERDPDGAPRRLTVAMADPFDVIALDFLRSLLGDGAELAPVLAGRADIERFLERAYRHDLSVSGILREIETGETDPGRIAVDGDEYSQPIVRLVDVLLSNAVQRGASDVHFEPEAGFLRVRYRIDGVLRQVRSLHRGYWSAIAVRLKVMCGMNIAETRAPQDGRISRSVSGRDIDFRVSSLPTAHGENIVLRVLDRSRGIVGLDELGMSPDALAELRRMMARPEGVILVTGPTGSGKTTTLYSILAHLDDEAVNIMTLEDPVEYPMPRIRQTSVNEAVKLDFAGGVRSLMRQDPDIILVGEIRDADTAAMTLRAAMTGHQVYSTLHANSAVGSIPRLLDIGVTPGVLAGNIIGIVAQRLVRRLCTACREPAAPAGARAARGDDAEVRCGRDGAPDSEPDGDPDGDPDIGPGGAGPDGTVPGRAPPPFRPVGCDRCDHLGYRGRLALTEVLRFDDELDALVAERAPVHELLAAAGRRGFVPLASDALRRVADGSTTLEEIARVVDVTRTAPSDPFAEREDPLPPTEPPKATDRPRQGRS